jgi:hypothetical protein
MAAAWAAPAWASLALVFLHPLMSLWFLDRQIAASAPGDLRAYRAVLAALPLLAAAVVASHGQAGFSGDPRLIERAAAGFVTLPYAPSLVALHAFLELLHYGVWIVALPLLGLASAPWRLSSIPLVYHRLGWPRAVRMTLLGGGLVVVLLWAAFAIDYSTTRQAYFTLAIVHVLAEVPAMIWFRRVAAR